MAAQNLPAKTVRRNRPSLERVRELFSYDPDTGQFTRLKRMGHEQPGPVLGGKTEHGYITFTIDGTENYAHRVAVLLMTGRWPVERVDHVDCDTTNNRWVNLREATHSENQANRGPTKRNTSGYKGVSRKRSGWRASISWQGQHYSSRTFKTKEEAAAEYRRMAETLHGEFARLVPADPRI